MKTIEKIRSIASLFKRPESNITMDELIAYPQGSLGFHLGRFLFDHSYEADPAPEREDIYRLLITKEVSNKEEIGMYYYLFGNGDLRLQTLFVLATGALLYPHCLLHFYRQYKAGGQALRFHDLDHFRMLHLPLQKIKDAFLIR